MTEGEYTSLRAIAAALWPSAVPADSARVWQAWKRSLVGYELRDAAEALEAMAKREAAFPSLADFIAGIRERREVPTQEVPKLPAPRRGVAGPPVQLPDDYVIGPFSRLFAEMNPEGWTVERMQEFTRRAAALHVQSAGGIGFGEAPSRPRPESLSDTAARIADEFLADPLSWPEQRRAELPEFVREAVREEIERRRAEVA